MIIVLLPVYNEKETIGEILDRMDQYADWIIIIDDGSNDGSGEIIGHWVNDKPNHQAFHHFKNLGKAMALRTGFRQILGLMESGQVDDNSIIVTVDGDGQHRVQDVKGIAAYMAEARLDMAVACRNLEEYPRYKKWGNALLSLQATLLSGIRYRDTQCGLRAIKAACIKPMLACYSGLRYSCEQEISIIVPRLGFCSDNAYEIPCPYLRSNPTLFDAIVNWTWGWIAFIKVMLNHLFAPGLFKVQSGNEWREEFNGTGN